MKKTNEAGIYQMPDGRLRIRATAKCPITGKMLETQRTMKAEASMEAAILMRENLKAALTAAPKKESKSITVGNYAKLWLERKGKRYQPSTATKNLLVLSDFVLPQLGHIPIDRLTRRDVAEWIMWAEVQTKENGDLYSSDYVAGWWRVMKVMLKDAHAQGFMEQDITTRQTPPDTGVSGRQETQTLTAEQLGLLIKAAKQFMPTRYPEIVTIALTGMRPGELYGLHWSEIDLDKAELTIKHSVYKGELGPPKTKSPRSVPFPVEVANALREHRQTLIKNQSPGLAAGIVFPADTGGYRFPSSLRKCLDILRTHLGFEGRVTPQVLRRTYNTLMMAAQVDRIVLWSIMGHSSESMTKRYSGVGMDVKRAAISKVFDASRLGSDLGPSDQTWDHANAKDADGSINT